jgi:hypothetical protein
MTQITPQELAQVVCPMAPQSPAISGAMSGTEGILLGAVFLVGIALGRFWQKLRVSSSRSHHWP